MPGIMLGRNTGMQVLKCSMNQCDFCIFGGFKAIWKILSKSDDAFHKREFWRKKKISLKKAMAVKMCAQLLNLCNTGYEKQTKSSLSFPIPSPITFLLEWSAFIHIKIKLFCLCCTSPPLWSFKNVFLGVKHFPSVELYLNQKQVILYWKIFPPLVLSLASILSNPLCISLCYK